MHEGVENVPIHGTLTWPDMEVILTMVPLALMTSGAKACVTAKEPQRLMSKIRLHSSILASNMGEKWLRPALLIR